MGTYRLKICPGLAILLLIFSWCALSGTVDDKLAAEIEKIKKEKEPVSPEELWMPDLPEKENGATFYRKAFSLLENLETSHAEIWKLVPYAGTIPWEKLSPEEKKKVAYLLLEEPSFQEFYSLIEKASLKKCLFFSQSEAGKIAELVLPYLNRMRKLTRLVCARVTLFNENHQPDQAIYWCLVGLRLSSCLYSPVLLVTALTGMAMDQVVLKALARTIKHQPLEKDICRKIQKILQEKGEENLLAQALITERVFGLQKWPAACILKQEGKVKPEQVNDPFTQEQLFYLRFITSAVKMAKKPYWMIKKQLEKEIRSIPANAFPIKSLAAAVEKAFQTEARYKSSLGAVGIGLGCYLYKLTYSNYPSSLQQLVPEFLPAIPVDPFTGKHYTYMVQEKKAVICKPGENSQKEQYQILWELP